MQKVCILDDMKIKDTKILQDWGFVRALASTFEHEGKEGEWIFFSRKKEQTAEAKAQPDAIVIVPFVTIPGPNRAGLLLTKEFRVPLADYEYGFPAGLVEPGQSYEMTARRELKEETGFKVVDVLYFSPPIFSSAGATDESVALVFVTAEADGDPEREEHEDISNLVLDKQGIQELMQRAFTEKLKIGAKAYPILLMAVLTGIANMRRSLAFVGEGQIQISADDLVKMMDALRNPPEPNEALKRAARRHAEEVDSRE